MNRRLLVCLALALTFAAVTSPAYAEIVLANNDVPTMVNVVPQYQLRGTRFGGQVAVSNGTMLATRTEGQLTGAYAAYVFVRNGRTWVQQQTISLPSDPRGVAIQNDTLAVSVRGGIQIWVRTVGTWQMQAQLTDIGSDYVRALSIDGDTLAAGRHVFVRSGEAWVKQQKLSTSHEQADANLGGDVEVKDDTIVIGASYENGSAPRAGAVYVFERTGDVWSETAHLVRANPRHDDWLGSTVAFDGMRIAAGVSGWASQTGAVCVWERAGSSWVLAQQVTAPDGRPGNLVDYHGDLFGQGLGLSGDTLIASAPKDDDRGADSGSVYVLRRVGHKWVHQRKITSPIGAAGDDLGSAIAFDGDTLVTGMGRDDTPLTDAGSVYLCDLGFVTAINTTLTVTTPRILANDILPSLDLVTAQLSAAPSHGTAVISPDGSFTYTPNPSWKGTDRFGYVCTDGVQSSNSASVTVQTWMPTAIALSASDVTPRYGRYTTLRASLKDLSGRAVAGQTVAFEMLSGTTWVRVGTVKTSTTGVATQPVYSLTRARIYRARTGWSALYGAAGSSNLAVRPHVSLTSPAAPADARSNRYFTTYGFLKPRHTSGTAPVKLYFYRYESGSWVCRKIVAATVKNYSGFSKYSKSVAMPASGSWRMRAYHPADSANSATWSSLRSFRVR